MSSPGSIQRTIPHGVAGQRKQIAVVPAKRKSKRCPDKNWKNFISGESLAQRATDKAVGCGFFDKTVLTIDFSADKVAFLRQKRSPAMRFGLYTRVRPRFIADDSVTVVLDALDSVKAKDEDVYCLLQPTSPFILKETIWKALEAVKANNQPVVSVNPMLKPSGGIYAGFVGNLREYCSFYDPLVLPLKLDWDESFDIDYQYDFDIARGLYE